MKLLNERYGITEKDFTRAEIEMVPAYKAVDIGLDRGLVGAYGQDDRVCAYTALMAEIGTKNPEHTTFTILTDKEEIGSVGNTGLHSGLCPSCGRGPRGELRGGHKDCAAPFHLPFFRCKRGL